MFVFKTSGGTFNSVITNQKHAFNSKPRAWDPHEIVLVSKNKADCGQHEKQIGYIMRIVDIREATTYEIDQLWPGNAGRWRYIIDCESTRELIDPFNLEDLLGEEADIYKSIMTFKKIEPNHEKIILEYIGKN